MFDPSQLEPVFDRPARQDIRECVRAYKVGEFVRAGGPPLTGGAGQTIHLVRANGTVTPSSIGEQFRIRIPNGSTKGGERDGPWDDLRCYLRKGLCLANRDYFALEVCGHEDATFEIIDPELCIAAVANADYLYNTTASFTVGGATLQALVENGHIKNGATYRLHWRQGVWLILDPDLLISGSADDYYFHGETGTFTVGGATVPALIRHGMTFDGTTYDLAWDGSAGRFLVLHPDLRFRGTTTAAIAAGATDGDVQVDYWNGTAYADTGEDFDSVLNGLTVDIASGVTVWCQFVAPTYSRVEIVQVNWECPE